MRNNSANDSQRADALTEYIAAITNFSITSNTTNILSIAEMNTIVSDINANNLTSITSTSILVITQPECGSKTTVIGASAGGTSNSMVISTDNYNTVINKQLLAAGVVNFTGECKVNRFNILIINDPTIYRTSNSTNTTVVSSIVIATIGTTGTSGVNVAINLYFENSTRVESNESGQYVCAFYDTNSTQWNQSGCFMKPYNTDLKRYECHCNHLTSFALIWLPATPPSDGKLNEYNAQDKASIAFQVISIVCFLAVIIHIVTVRIIHPTKYIRTTHLLPIMSCGVTMLLFIFYIALGLTVYTRYMQSPSTAAPAVQRERVSKGDSYGKYSGTELNSRIGSDPPPGNLPYPHIPCLPSEHGLMFVVYFFIIFMFCTKISIAIDNYRRYVRLFPPLSYRAFIITMAFSLVISAIWLGFAAGFNSNPANQITQIYENKLCWFNRRVNHYFLTIPVCLFLFASLVLCIPVVKHNISHAHKAEEDIDLYIRRKRCIYILLASCGTQGFGWLFGPVISLATPTAGEVLGWFFIIFNGLEGLWALLLYIVVEKEGLDHSPRHLDYVARQPYTMDNDKDLKDDDKNFELTNLATEYRRDPLTGVRSDSPRYSFADLPEQQIIHRSNNVVSDVF